AGLSQFFVNTLIELEDPRLRRWAQEATLGVYAGMQSGYRQGSVPELQSRWLNNIKNEPLLGNIMNYAELQFILAEAALEGYITGDPKTYYDNGVKAAIEMWGLTYPSNYLDNTLADYSSAVTYEEKLKKI